MSRMQVRLFGRASVAVDGAPVELPPTAMSVFIRLAIADGAAVAVDDIFRAIWPLPGRIGREERTRVQRQVLDIRTALEAVQPGAAAEFLRTLRGGTTAYQLVLDRGSVDVLEFTDLISRARRATLREKILLIQRALDLCRAGLPLADVVGRPWAASLARQLGIARQEAMLDLMTAYQRASRGHDALDMAEELARELPDDAPLAASLATLRHQVRVGQHKQVFREDLTDPPVAIVVQSGDLFAHDDANLVVGFCDTFDTDTYRNVIISAESTQGMLLDRIYGGDRARLEQDLRPALSRVPRVSTETRAAKPRGKLIRYPIGTVATLHHPTRRVFGVAYSRMGNNLVARSSVPWLRASLDNLWDAVYLHGQLKPVAMPLIGSGLSRVHEASYEDLLTIIVTSFVACSRLRYMCPELRVVVREDTFEKIRVVEVLKSIREGNL